MEEFLIIAGQLFGLYVGVAVWIIGFVIMIGGLGRSGRFMLFGTTWVGSTMRFFFVRPFVVIARGAGYVLWQTLSLIGTGAYRFFRWLIRTLIRTLVDPVLIVIGRALRRIFLPQR